MTTLKIIAKTLDIEFDKGGTFRPIFYVLDKNNNAINLTGYGAVMQLRLAVSDIDPLIDLSVANGSISITPPVTLEMKKGEYLNGEELTKDLTIYNVYALQPRISSAHTSAIAQEKLVYLVDLIEPSLDVIKYLKGDVQLNLSGAGR